MNKKTILYTAVSVVVVAGVAALIIWKVGQNADQPAAPGEQPVSADSFDTDASIEEGELGEYGKLLNEMKFESLDEEFKEIDELVNQL